MENTPCIAVAHGPVTEITISRPRALNALNRQVLDELQATFAALAQADVRCVILTGAGKAFVAGADIAEMAAATPAQAEAMAGFGQAVFRQIETFAAPVLAAVNGFAFGGGCELALACDAVYAAEGAQFGQPEVKLGLMPGFGGSVRLPRKIGPGHAAEWIFTGNAYSAAHAHALGLVQAVYPAESLLPQVREVAATIASRAPLAVRAAKRVLAHTAAGAEPQHLERFAFGQLFAGADVREGTAAFLEKRAPRFEGR